MFLLRRLFSVFPSLCIFLFSALALIVPSGYTLGPFLLFLASFFLLFNHRQLVLNKKDWLFLCLMLAYVMINILLNTYHSLPANSYDKPLRYLLGLPVYLLLISYPLKQSYFWFGLIFGALGALSIAIYQQTSDTWVIIAGRSTGFLNAIQFGDIAVLLVGLLLSGTLCLHHSKKQNFLLMLSSMIALIASFLSFSRGGWLALVVIVCVLYIGTRALTRKKIILFACSFFVIITLIFYLLPDSNLFKVRIATTAQEISTYLQYGGKEYTSVSVRFLMWESGMDAFSARPLLGWGSLGSIMSAFPSQWEVLKTLDNFNHLHNEYIDALAKKGLVGFAALMAMYLVPLYYFVGLMRTRQADVMPFAAAGVILILCVMVFGLTQCFLAHNSGTMVFVFYLVIIKAYCRNIVAARIPAAQT